MKKAYK